MSFSQTALFLCIATIVFLLGWLGLLPFDGQKKRNRKWLLAHGQPVVARVINIRHIYGRKGSAGHWVIVAEWSDPVVGTVHTFESLRLDKDPSVHVKSGVVTVLIDPQNPRRHHIDLSEIQQTAGP